MGAEAFRTRREPEALADDGYYGTATALAAYESLDDEVFPRDGIAASARAQLATGTHTFGRYIGQAQAYTAVGPLVPFARIAAAHITSGGPPHRVFALGGIGLSPLLPAQQFDLAGYRAEALAGRSIALGSVGVRWDAGGGRHLSAQVDGARIGSAFDALDTFGGWGVVASQETPLGPLELAAFGRGDDEPLAFQLALGYRF